MARRNRISTILLILYVLVLSLWGFDLLMSLDPLVQRPLRRLLRGDVALPGFGLVTFLTIRGNARGLTAASPSAIQDVAKLTFASA